MNDCSSCKFCFVDYVYNSELCEEYEKYCCEKGHDTDCEKECKDYKQDEPQEYVEEFTKCDSCELLASCFYNGKIVEITQRRDSSRHYTNKIGSVCWKTMDFSCKERGGGKMSNEEQVRQHKEVCELLNSTYEQKNRAYGNSFGDTYKDLGIISAVTRISDKFNRLKTLARNKDINQGDESIADTLLDMANYCIMTYMELQNENKCVKENKDNE